MTQNGKNTLIFIALLVTGVVIGSILGEYCATVKELEFMSKSFKFGLEEPFSLDLGIFKCSLSFLFKLNIASALGIIGAVIAYKKI